MQSVNHDGLPGKNDAVDVPGDLTSRSSDPSSATPGRHADAWVAPEAAPPQPGENQVALVGGSVAGDRLGAAGSAIARGDARHGGEGSRGLGPGPSSSDRHGFDDENPLAALALSGPAAVLDGGFDLLRFRFRRLVGLAACLFLPIQIVQLLISISRGVASDASGGGLSVLGRSGDGQGLVLLIGLARAVALSLLGIGVGHMVAGWLAHRDPTFRETVGHIARRCWCAPAIVAISLAVKLPASCLVVVGFFLADALLFTSSVASGAEALGPWRAVRRSWSLGRAGYGTALTLSIGGFVISEVLRVVLLVGPLALASFFDLPDGLLIIVQQSGLLVLLITEPLTACIAARGYLELRCRTEGFDLERRAESRGLT